MGSVDRCGEPGLFTIDSRLDKELSQRESFLLRPTAGGGEGFECERALSGKIWTGTRSRADREDAKNNARSILLLYLGKKKWFAAWLGVLVWLVINSIGPVPFINFRFMKGSCLKE
jgi:hypothetical protein